MAEVLENEALLVRTGDGDGGERLVRTTGDFFPTACAAQRAVGGVKHGARGYCSGSEVQVLRRLSDVLGRAWGVLIPGDPCSPRGALVRAPRYEEVLEVRQGIKLDASQWVREPKRHSFHLHSQISLANFNFRLYESTCC